MEGWLIHLSSYLLAIQIFKIRQKSVQEIKVKEGLIEDDVNLTNELGT